jgi:hypothetical protein
LIHALVKCFPFNAERRLNQKKYPEASEKCEILPGDKIDYLEQISC